MNRTASPVTRRSQGKTGTVFRSVKATGVGQLDYFRVLLSLLTINLSSFFS
jgi:hypothetical protein